MKEHHRTPSIMKKRTQVMYKKLILQYATTVAKIAKGDSTSKQEQEQLSTIEAQLQLTSEAILREATKLALSSIK